MPIKVKRTAPSGKPFFQSRSRGNRSATKALAAQGAQCLADEFSSVEEVEAEAAWAMGTAGSPHAPGVRALNPAGGPRMTKGDPPRSWGRESFGGSSAWRSGRNGSQTDEPESHL